MGQHRGARGRQRGARTPTPWIAILAATLGVVAVVLSARALMGEEDGRPTSPERDPFGGDGRPLGPDPVSSGTGLFSAPAPTSISPADTEALCPGCNVVLITMCSLRKDHVGTYGVASAQFYWGRVAGLLHRLGYHLQNTPTTADFDPIRDFFWSLLYVDDVIMYIAL